MHDDGPLLPDLPLDLRSYFALTTAVALPPGVRRIDARALQARRRHLTVPARVFAALVGGGGAVAVAAAAVVILLAGHHFGGGAAAAPSRPADLAQGAATYGIALYPGIDTSVLARAGATVSLPAGHGAARVTAEEAQAVAASAQINAEAPGAAVLVWAQLNVAPQSTTCLCWIVDVPIAGGVAQDSKAIVTPRLPPAQTVLVFIDAASGRVVDSLSAPGIP